MSVTIQRTVIKFTLVKIFAFVLLVCFSTNSVLAVVCLCTSPLFPPGPNGVYPVGTNPQGIETGDFNGDSKLDLITANASSNNISILLGNGTGGFSPIPAVPLISLTIPQTSGINPQKVIVGHFNTDQQLDFATANLNSDNISVGYNNGNDVNGNLTFTIMNFSTRNAGTPNTSVSPKHLTTGNFIKSFSGNPDGGLDIATCNGDGTVSVFRNMGASFSKLDNFNLDGSPNLYSISSADFNGDQWDDIVATRHDPVVDQYPIYVMLNGAVPTSGGNGWTWSVNRPLAFHESVISSVTGDFDNDGKSDDLAVGTSYAGSYIRVFRGNPDGTLTKIGDGYGPAGYFGGPLSAGDFNLDKRLDLAAASADNRSNNGFFALNIGDGYFDNNISSVNLNSGHVPTDTAVGDFNKDGRPDVAFAVTISNTAEVLLNTHNENAISKTDYGRDGGTDYAVWRPSNGDWYVLNSFFPNDPNKQINYHFGAYGDVPVQGDYDGDKKTDFAVFRLNNNTWYILHSSSNGPFISQLWGASNDKLVPGDYDGDCKTDIAIYRPSLGLWCIIKSSNGSQQYTQFGANDDIPVQGDYDSDGKTDLAVFRPSNNTWYIQRSTAGFLAQQWGAPADKPVPGDYDGDCKTDIAVFRPSTGGWHIIKSSGGFLNYQVGISTDTPQQGDYDGDGKTDAAIWRSSAGLWSVLKSSDFNVYPFNASSPPPPTNQYWGTPGDIPTASIYPVQ